MATRNDYLKFEELVKTLTQEQLIEKTRSLFQKEKSIEDALIIVLTEIYRRRIYSALGYSSIFDFLTQYFHLSAANAYQKMGAIKFMIQVPEAKDKLLSGETNVSQLAILNTHINNSEKQNQLKLDPIEKAGLFNNVLGLSNLETKRKLEDEIPLSPPPADKNRIVKNDQVHIACTISKELFDKIQYLKSLQSHKNLNPSMGELLEIMTDLAIENLEKKKGIREPKIKVNKEINPNLDNACETKQKNESPSQSTDARCVTKNGLVKKRSRYIPRDVKRAVIKRAQNQCEFISQNGRRCECRTRLQFEHLEPWSLQGENTIENLAYYCFEHNQYTAHQFFNKDPREYKIKTTSTDIS